MGRGGRRSFSEAEPCEKQPKGKESNLAVVWDTGKGGHGMGLWRQDRGGQAKRGVSTGLSSTPEMPCFDGDMECVH